MLSALRLPNGSNPPHADRLQSLPYKANLGLSDFSPASQDAVALQQIRERGALPLIDAGNIQLAIQRCANLWASLPGAGYAQPEQKMDRLLVAFVAAGGKVVT